jgi:membrane dipeptidase
MSHLSDDAVADVLRFTDVPVIASHSGMRHYTPASNLSDASRRRRHQGGVVQIVFGSAFIDRDGGGGTGLLPRRADLRDNAAAVAAGRPSFAGFDKAGRGAPAGGDPARRGARPDRPCGQGGGIDHVGIARTSMNQRALPRPALGQTTNLVADLQRRGPSDADIRRSWCEPAAGLAAVGATARPS